MKGIVVEINQKDAVVLADNGIFTKVKNEKYEVGQTIKIKESRKVGSKWIAGAAGMVAAAAICTTGAVAYTTPTDYISLDVNPSVEYSINRFDRILDVKAVNDDGQELLSDLDLENKTIEDGVKETLDQLINGGYLSDDFNGGVVIATSNDEMEKAEQLATELEEELQAYLDSREGITAKVEAEAVAPERVLEAREMGVTPGKLNLVNKLQESTSGAIDAKEWLTMPVKEINKAIKENRIQSKDHKQDRSNTEVDQEKSKDGYRDINLKKDEKDEKDRGKQVVAPVVKEEDRNPDWKYLDRKEDYDDDRQKDDEEDPENIDDEDSKKGGWKNKDRNKKEN